jgi:hypothetical protein
MSLLICAQLVDSLTDCYPQIRAWSQPALLQRTDAKAIGYGSRRNVPVRITCRPRWLCWWRCQPVRRAATFTPPGAAYGRAASKPAPAVPLQRLTGLLGQELELEARHRQQRSAHHYPGPHRDGARGRDHPQRKEPG